ncbi:MAG: hypothetical protein Kow00103_03070 [Candidatus Caldatribacteriota bacterium]
MNNLSNLPIQDLIHKEIICSCGKLHKAGVKDIILGENILSTIPTLLTKYQCQNLFLVADKNTYQAAGQKVEQILREHSFNLTLYIFQREKSLVADEKAIGELTIRINKDTDIIVAVGSGTINDIVKYVAYKLSIPYIIVTTAPSMDGYPSFVAPLITGNLKVTYEATPPRAIIADIEILKKAPLDMFKAGIGDMLGKYTALVDWELTKIINNECYCEWIVSLVKKSVEKCIENIAGILKREEKAVAFLTEGLILSGIAMNFMGNSRPASGSEHHLSHCWEIIFLLRGKEAVLHGIKVGISTIVITKLFKLLQSRKVLNFTAAREKVAQFDQGKWNQEINQIFLNAAPLIIEQEIKARKNSLEQHRKRIQLIEEKWPEIIKIMDQMAPTVETIEKNLQKVEAPVNPTQIDIDAETFYHSLIYGKEVRSRYGILQLLWDLGLLEELSKEVVEYFFQKKPVMVTSISEKEKDILKKIKCFILDMDGTFYLGNNIIEGALSFTEKIKKCGKNFYFFTNNSSRHARYYQDKLKKMGCLVKQEDILTANQVILKYLKENHQDQKIYLLGNNYLREDFIREGMRLVEERPDLVIVGFDTTLEYERVVKACHYIRRGIPFWAVNPDLNCPVEEGFIPDCGSICAMITASTGIKPLFFGKPSFYTQQYILDFTRLEAEEIAYIGDRLYTDIAMGKRGGMVTILVLSGETSKEDLANSSLKPDLVYPSLKEIKMRLDEIYPEDTNFKN